MLLLGYPLFQQVTGQTVPLAFVFRGEFVLAALGLTLLLGTAAASYPALYLSGFRPIPALRSSGGSSGRPALLRQGLVVFQFAISIGLIAAATVIWYQVSYLQTKDLGFNTDNLIVIDARTEKALDNLERLRDRFRRSPSIEAASSTGWLPVLQQGGTTTARASGRKEVELTTAYVDTTTLQTLGIDLIASQGYAAGSKKGTVLNRAAVESFGWSPSEAVGKQVYVESMFRPVLGVTENFHHAPLRREIEPLVSRKFALLLGIGFIIAVPLAWYGLRQWLDNFAYRIDLGPGLFVLAGLIAAVLAFGATGYQSIKAALTNPADSLRYE